MYVEKGRSSLAQFILNNVYKEGTVGSYGIYLNEKSNEVIVFNHKNVYIIKHQLMHLYPKLDAPRINIGATHFEIDGVEIDKSVLINAMEWWKKRLELSATRKRKQAGTSLRSSMMK